MKEQSNLRKENQENMEIQEQIKKIKARQLGRLIEQLRAINMPQIVIDATEKYFNFFLIDTLDLISSENQRKLGNNDKSNNQDKR